MRVLLVTGGAGFIGSNFIRYFLRRNKDFIIVNMDKLTSTSNLDNLKDLEDSPRYHFIKGDICNYELVNYVLRKYKPSFIINFAAEPDTVRNADNPAIFVETNIMGTITLLQGARYIWGKQSFKGNRFIQVSTDEVYGGIDNETGYFTEESKLAPESLYSASKAGADLMVRAFSKTYGIPAITTRCCNNYGPCQSIEQFIPACIINALQDKPISIYGDGTDVREWIYVLDYCTAIIRALFYGKPGEIYNIGTEDRISNIELAKKILKLLGKPEDRIEIVKDSPEYERRFALNSYKARNNFNWSNKYRLDVGLKETIDWYKRRIGRISYAGKQ